MFLIEDMVGECPVVFLYIFWDLFVELGGLLTPSVTRLSFFVGFASWRPYSLLPLSVSKSRAQVSSVLLSSLTLDLSKSEYTAVWRITRNFLIE